MAGASSPDSDYDARFIYVHRQPWYLTVNESTGPGDAQRDVIELPIDDALDVSGWDLRKALRLVSKSNPTLIEWLRSPIVYRQDDAAVAQLWEAAKAFYSPLGTWWHYFNMARSNHRGYLRGDTVRTKKYLYVLRPLLACQWIEHEQTPPPMAFEDLLDRRLPEGPCVKRSMPLVVKRASAEVAAGPRIAAISDFIEGELAVRAARAPSLPPDRATAPGWTHCSGRCWPSTRLRRRPHRVPAAGRQPHGHIWISAVAGQRPAPRGVRTTQVSSVRTP